MTRTFPWLLGAVGLLALLLIPSTGVPQEIERVFVTNFPNPQNIKGSVSIREPVPLSQQTNFSRILVPPVTRGETTRLISAGILTTDGFPSVVLSLQGQIKGELTRRGKIGAILLPDQEAIREPFDELGLIQFPLEVATNELAPGAAYFSSNQPRYTVGFQAYEVLLYNTTDKTVTVNLYAYLTN